MNKKAEKRKTEKNEARRLKAEKKAEAKRQKAYEREHGLTEYRFFTPADFREEQAYLEFKHRQGKAFVGVHHFKYTFEEVPPKKMTYERDFKEDDIFIDDYVKMYEDAGWKFVFRNDECYYFRKHKVEQPEEKEEFSTYYDRAKYFSGVQMKWMSDTFVVLILAVFGIVALSLAGSFALRTFVDGLLVAFAVLMLLFSMITLGLLYAKYKRIQDIELTEPEKQEKREEQGITTITGVNPYNIETSAFGEFQETDLSFDEVLETKLK